MVYVIRPTTAVEVRVFARNVAQVNVVLMLHARASLRANEIARAASLPRQIVAAALGTLAKKGIARRRREGLHDVFEADRSSAYYPAAYLTAVVDLPIAAALGRQRVLAAYLYGSLATPGGGTPRSDIDLLLVGDFPDTAATRDALSLIGEHLERRMDPLLLSPEDVERGRITGDPLVTAALAGIRIQGEV